MDHLSEQKGLGCATSLGRTEEMSLKGETKVENSVDESVENSLESCV